MSSLKESLEILSQRSFRPTLSVVSAEMPQDVESTETKFEVKVLQETIDALRAELGTLHIKPLID
jgi:hypothetical protein